MEPHGTEPSGQPRPLEQAPKWAVVLAIADMLLGPRTKTESHRATGGNPVARLPGAGAERSRGREEALAFSGQGASVFASAPLWASPHQSYGRSRHPDDAPPSVPRLLVRFRGWPVSAGPPTAKLHGRASAASATGLGGELGEARNAFISHERQGWSYSLIEYPVASRIRRAHCRRRSPRRASTATSTGTAAFSRTRRPKRFSTTTRGAIR
jgi:hypothetical protein